MSLRNESRTRRPSVKTIEPHLGRVNERSHDTARRTVLSRSPRATARKAFVFPRAWQPIEPQKTKGAAPPAPFIAHPEEKPFSPAYWGGGGV